MDFDMVLLLFLFSFCVRMSEEKLFLRHLNVCVPPKGDVCIAIRDCPYFNDLLNNSPLPRPRNVIKIIRDRQCGFNGKIPYVCCQSQRTTTTIKPKITKTEPSVNIGRLESLIDHYNYYLLPQDNCGVIKASFRITNGQQTSLNEYPWMALIFYKSTDGVLDFKCGGTLINERYVLTAAHCVVNQSLAGIRLGDYNVETQLDCEPNTGYCAPPPQDFMIEKVLVHPRYNARTFLNDIALIKLRGAANFDYENVKPICLPLETELTSRTATVTGWGVTEDGYKSQVLLQVRLPILPLPECQSLYQKFATINSNQICAGGYKGRDSCGGDSGGPLKDVGEVNGTMRFIQYGIVSFGPKYCGTEGKPGVYTKVSSYIKWILDNLEE